MVEEGMVFVTVTRRLSGSHGLGIMLRELPCAQGEERKAHVLMTCRTTGSLSNKQD
jgi:hypothetical protein